MVVSFTEFIHSFRLVEKTLKPLDPERRAYRLVGGVLVERTVLEVLPSVTANRENVSPAVGDAMKNASTHIKHLCCTCTVAGESYCLIARATRQEAKGNDRL